MINDLSNAVAHYTSMAADAELWADAQRHFPLSPSKQAAWIKSVKHLHTTDRGWVCEPRNRVQRKTPYTHHVRHAQ